MAPRSAPAAEPSQILLIVLAALPRPVSMPCYPCFRRSEPVVPSVQHAGSSMHPPLLHSGGLSEEEATMAGVASTSGGAGGT